MLLKEYLADLITKINEFIETGVVLSSDVTTDYRTEKIGYIKGYLTFIDGSTLYFKEYIDLRYHLQKQTYSFHYQDKNADLCFRYDNASHKPDLGFQNHKHIGTDIILTNIPDLGEVLEEIISSYFTT